MKLNFKTKYTIACGQEISISAEVTLNYSDNVDARYVSNMDLTVNGYALSPAGHEAITDEDWANIHQHVIDESTNEE